MCLLKALARLRARGASNLRLADDFLAAIDAALAAKQWAEASMLLAEMWLVYDRFQPADRVALDARAAKWREERVPVSAA